MSDSSTAWLFYDIGIIRAHDPHVPSKRQGRLTAALNECKRATLPLALGELLTSARLVQTDLLPLNLARVARHQSGLRQRRLELDIVVDQGAGDAVAHGAGLPRFATAVDVDHDVER